MTKLNGTAGLFPLWPESPQTRPSGWPGRLIAHDYVRVIVTTKLSLEGQTQVRTHYLVASTCMPMRAHCALCKVLQDKW